MKKLATKIPEEPQIEAAFPGRIIPDGVNFQAPLLRGKGVRELDIVMDQFIIQVKKGAATGLVGQIKSTMDDIAKGFLPGMEGKTVVGFALSGKFSSRAWFEAALEGIPIARNIDELFAIIRELSK